MQINSRKIGFILIFLVISVLSLSTSLQNYGFLAYYSNTLFEGNASMTYDYEPSYNNGSLYAPTQTNPSNYNSTGFQGAEYDQFVTTTVSLPMKTYSIQFNGSYGGYGALTGGSLKQQSQGLTTTSGIGIQSNSNTFQKGINLNYLNNSDGGAHHFTPGGTVGFEVNPFLQYEHGAGAYALVGDMQQTYSQGGIPGLALELEPEMTYRLTENLTYASLFEWRIVNNAYVGNGIVSTSGNQVMGDTLEYQPLVLMYSVPQIKGLMATFEVKLDWYNFRACQTYYGINFNSWVTLEPDIQYYLPINDNLGLTFDVKDEISQLLQASNYGRTPNQQNWVFGITATTYFGG